MTNDTLPAPGGQPALPPAGLLHRLLGLGRLPFYAAAVVVLAAVLGSGYGLYHLLQLRIDYQEQRNAYLKSEVAKLETQLAQLDQPRKEADAIRARAQAIQAVYEARATGGSTSGRASPSSTPPVNSRPLT